MAGTADQAADAAVGLDVTGAADQIASLLVDDDDEQGEQQDESGSSQTDEQSEGESQDGSEEEGAGEENQEQAQRESAQLITVKIDGKETQIPLSELVNGYQRSADYTRKTQALAQQRREQEAEFTAVKQERARYGQLLQLLEQQLTEGYNEPNWDQLRQTDPMAFATKWAEHQQLQQRRAAIAQQQQMLSHQQALDEQARLRERVAAEGEQLLEVIPAWKDAAKAKTERAALVEYGQKLGFTPEELNSVYDHRAVNILYKAWKYDQALARRGAAQAQAQANAQAAAPRTLQPGQSSVRQVTDVTRAKQRLAKTGRVEDAAALFERFL